MKIKRLAWTLMALLLPAMSALADGPFRQHRYNALTPLEVNEQSIVFLGNSITNMAEWREFFGNDPRIVNRGTSGGYTHEWTDNMEAVLAGKPAKIFYGLGTNDLGTAGDYYAESVIVERVRSFIRRVHAESPNTMLYIQSVHPSNAGLRSVAKINAYNAAVDAMIAEEQAAGNDQVEYLPVPGMDGIISDGFMSYDRLHMTGKGYSVWTHAIADKVGVTATLPDADASWTQASANLGGSTGMRAAQFSVLPVTAEDVLVVGGEVVHGGEWHELFGNANVKSRGTQWGAGGLNLGQHKAQMEQCILGNLKGNQTSPKAVVLYIGQYVPVDNTTFQADYKAMVDAVFTRSEAIGGTTPKVYCVSLLPLGGTDRTAFNTAIQTVCNSADYNGETGKTVKYVDIASGMTDNATTIKADYKYPGHNYISGIGYAKMAELMAAAIPEVAPTAGRTTVTEVKARANMALFAARKQLGDAIESNRSGMITASEEGIAAALATLDDMSYGSADPAATATAAIAALNATRMSHFDASKWYAIKMPDQTRLCYVAVNHGNALSGNQTPYTHDAWWKIIAREDGKFDLKDYQGRYIVPDNFVAYDGYNHLTVSETAPATGWSISRAGDKYIITNGTVQMHVNHQNPPKYHVMNYGGGSNTSDSGCLFAFEEIDEAQNVPTFLEATAGLTQVTGASPVIETGWYVVRNVTDGVNQVGVGAGFDVLYNRATSLSHNNQPYYLGFDHAEGFRPDMLVRFEKVNDTSFKIRLMNGGVVSSAYELTGTEGAVGLALADADDNTYKLGGSWPFWKESNGSRGLILGYTGNDGNRATSLVYKADSKAAEYDWYQVTVNGTAPDGFSITYNGTDCQTQATVNNGGFYFFTKDSQIAPLQFTCTANAEGKLPTVSIDAASKTITADYNNVFVSPEDDFEARKISSVASLTSGWYQVKLVAGNNNIAENSRYIVNANNEQTHSNGQYALKLGTINIEKLPTSFVRLTASAPSGTSVNVEPQGLNGHAILSDVRAAYTVGSDLTSIAEVNDGFTIGSYWMVFDHTMANINGGAMENPMVGKGFNSSGYHWAISPVTDLTPYKVYQISIVGGEKPESLNATRVAMSGAENKGIEKVFDGGYFFVDKDAEVTPTSFTPDAIEGKVATVAIGTADEDGIIPVTVTYAEKPVNIQTRDEIVDGAWYTVKLVTAHTSANQTELEGKSVIPTTNPWIFGGTRTFELVFADYPEATPAKAYIKMTKGEGNLVAMQLSNGHNLDKTESFASNVAKSFNVTGEAGVFNFGGTAEFKNDNYGGQWFMSNSSNGGARYAIFPVSESELASLQAYRVSIEGGLTVGAPSAYSYIVPDAAINKGAERVYDGGYVFVANDGVVTAATFAASEVAGKIADVEIGEAGEDGIIPVTVTYKNARTVSITAPAEDAHYSLRVTAADGNEIHTGDKVAEGTQLTVTVAPDEGYAITVAEGMTAADNGSYTSTITVGAENVTIAPVVTAKQLFTISWEEGDEVHYIVSVTNGDAVVANGSAVVEGSTIRVELEAKEGYIISEARRNDTPITASEGTFNATFEIAENVNITATTKKLYVVTWNVAEDANYTVAVEHGGVAIDNGTQLSEGTELTVTFTAAEGYHIEKLGETEYEGFDTKTVSVTVTVGEAMAFPEITVAPDIVEPDAEIGAPTTEGVESTLGEGEKKEDKPVFYEAPTTEVGHAIVTFHHNSELESVELPAALTDAVGKGDGEFVVVNEDESIATGELDREAAKLTITRKSKVGQTMLTIVWRPAAVSRAVEDGDIELAKVLVKVITPGAAAPVLTNNSGTVTLYLNQSSTPMIAVEPEGVANALIYESTNPAVATVDPATGLITALSAGSCEILVRMEGFDGVLLRIPVVAKNATGNPGQGVTGIDAVNADAAEGRAEIYDLAGRRIKRVAAAGIYIVNGVKTLVR